MLAVDYFHVDCAATLTWQVRTAIERGQHSLIGASVRS